uniref:Uncharacterized protein n=1 Tax=Leersia perrieri TaxID=77586 RepID=A0A0D9WZX8_9ORYZ
MAYRYLAAASLVVVLLLLQQAPLIADAQPMPWRRCNVSSGNYTENSTYHANIEYLATSLPAYASSSPSLFASGSSGTIPDTIYALALCRGDTTNASACAACVSSAIETAQKHCALVKTVNIYDDPCIVRFSSQPFPISSPYSLAAFDAEIYPKIYSLAQCTPDMTAANCRSCLEDIIYLVGRKGGRVLGIRCNFRFETYPFFFGQPLLQLPGPPASSSAPVTGESSKHKSSAVVGILVPAIVLSSILVWFCSWNWRRRLAARSLQPIPTESSTDDMQSIGSLLDLSTLRVATDDFSEHKRLGEGGFGVVYKGDLPKGQQIAVKRLARTSKQGIEELKTELLLVAKLNHNNLVRLIGVCLEENEKILAYEYMPNRSLDTILFDAQKIKELNWGQRFNIINGIARGLQYLHEDSQLKIVHRDLKASNILLDSAYNPKISDFGLAKIFERDQSQVITHRIAGTYGYMSPEYAMRGQYSIKSDVFSFGVLILEIITGRRNFGSYGSEHNVDLINVTWDYWIRGEAIELIDPSLGGHYPIDKALKCLHIGLLCVQPKPADRPLMSAVNVMLSSTVRIPSLSKPAFWFQEIGDSSDLASSYLPFHPNIAATCVHSAMRRRTLLVVHAVLLLAAVTAQLPLAAGQPWSLCPTGGGTYAPNSTYETNLQSLISELQQNASTSPTLFAAGSLGAAPDAVYGVILCRGDVSSSDCYDCGTRSGQDVAGACNRTRGDAVLVYNQCYTRFSDTDFLTSMNNSGEAPLMNSDNVTSADVAGYDRAVTDLLDATLRYAVENASTSTSTRMLFATGQRVGADPGFASIYSAAQCTPDMSPAMCRSCLEDLVGKWWKIFPRTTIGARIVGTRCNLRSEVDKVQFYTGEPMLKIWADGLSPASSPGVVPGTSRGQNNSANKILEIVLPILTVAIVAAISFCLWNKRKKSRWGKADHFAGPDTSEDFESVKSTLLPLASLQVATDNFNESMKLGEGGFGVVYKGVLSGQEVAVKRLAKGSNQGLEEMKNELVLVAKLHHKNLVRLLGFCLEEGERLLVYEYMSNKSLDTFLFDEEHKRQLDWMTRFRIIEGVARGLQYLHQDSQKKIVHRDMKASNILLDADMNPKIGDFGLARLFGQDQTREITKHIVGTFGYMSPEYVTHGQYSTKLDVFSFGIIVIEIVTGRRRNNGPYYFEQNEDIISVVWRHWAEGNIAEMIDHSLGRNYPEEEVLKCINIGLLCVQQNPVDRPTMADVMVLLNSDANSTLPALVVHRPTSLSDESSGYSQTVTQLSPR